MDVKAQALSVGLKGMLGVFAAMLIVALVTLLLTKIFASE